MDSALMLLARRAGSVVLADLTRAADAAAHLARTYRSTPMVARTLGQQALPTTFGLLATSWFTALDSAAVRLDTVLSALPVQFGGAAGTLAASYPDGLTLADALADELGLARQVVRWHTDRVTIAELATAPGIVAGAVSKPATDITVMASTELSEVAENSPGGSSAMPHKQNPVAGRWSLACRVGNRHRSPPTGRRCSAPTVGQSHRPASASRCNGTQPRHHRRLDPGGACYQSTLGAHRSCS